MVYDGGSREVEGISNSSEVIESGEAPGINFTYIKNILKLFPMLKPLQKTEKRKK